MGEKRYQIVTKGEIVGTDIKTVKQRVARLFKTDPSKVGRFFRGKPVCIKGGLDQGTAEKYKQAMMKAGLQCKMVPQKSSKQPESDASAPSGRKQESPPSDNPPPGNRKDCPKCGQVIRFSDVQPDDCPHCGIVIQKFIDSQNRKTDSRRSSGGRSPEAREEAGSNGLAYTMLIIGVVCVVMAAWFHFVKTDEQKQLKDNITSLTVLLKFKEAAEKQLKLPFAIPMDDQPDKTKEELTEAIDQMRTYLERINKKRRWLKWIFGVSGAMCLYGFVRLRK